VNGGGGCKTPSVATVQSREYRPLSRGLFVYAKKKAFKRDVVAAFIRHMIVNEKTIAQKARIVPLTKSQLRKAQRQYNTAIRNRRDY
jgi:ABC-type phosphate transport system substrate-binding protein